MSLKEFMALIAPNVKGSFTTGVMISTVSTKAISLIKYTPASSPGPTITDGFSHD